MNKAQLISGLALLMSASSMAICPDGSSFDQNLDFCADGTNAFGPFTNEMVQGCINAGGGSACTNTYQYSVQGVTIDVLRWSEGFTANLRGDGNCPAGSVRSPSYGGHCFEQTTSGSNNIYGNFSGEEVDACQALGGGTACYTNRWSANFYNNIKDYIASNPDDGSDDGSTTEVVNRLGAWLWYIDEAGLNKTHTQLADELADMGVKRVFIKIADNDASCSLFADACSTTTTEIYKSRGIEPWAWSYNYPGNDAAQAYALYEAAQYGYVGYVLDVEVEFNNTSTALHNIFQAFHQAKQNAVNAGYIDQSFPIGATTWSNPIDQGMDVGIIDQYVDFHMPQTYLEVWGASYMADAKRWIEQGNADYRAMGANKPIWHIVSTEYDEITPSQLTEFIKVAGPNTSIWRVPGGEVPQAVWNDWRALDWQTTDFDNNVMDHGNSNDMMPWMADSPTDGGSDPQPDPTPQLAYYHQLDNYYEPYGTCSVTSLAMVTDMHGFTDPAVNGRSPDYLYEELGGVLQTVPSLANGYNTMAIRAGSSKRAMSTTSGTITQLREALAAGHVAIVHGWFTNPGHIMVVTAFDGEYYTVNDPFGRWNEQKWGSYNSNVSGEGIKYPRAAFEYAINDNGTGDDLWLHIFE